MKKMKSLAAVTITASALLLAGCGSPKVSYVNPNSVDTTTINYGSTDLQTITSKMVDSMLKSPAIAKITAHNSQPVVYIGGLENNTDEHINTQAITNAISTRLINSGLFRFIDMTQVNKVKRQLKYQAESGMVDQKTAVAAGHQLGARYMLYGQMSSINQRNSRVQSLYFQVTMKLMDIKTGIIVWQGEKQIRKEAVRHRFSW